MKWHMPTHLVFAPALKQINTVTFQGSPSESQMHQEGRIKSLITYYPLPFVSVSSLEVAENDLFENSTKENSDDGKNTLDNYIKYIKYHYRIAFCSVPIPLHCSSLHYFIMHYMNITVELRSDLHSPLPLLQINCTALHALDTLQMLHPFRYSAYITYISCFTNLHTLHTFKAFQTFHT